MSKKASRSKKVSKRTPGAEAPVEPATVLVSGGQLELGIPEQDAAAELLGRTASAAALGITLSKLRRMEARDELPAIKDERGNHYHSIQQINHFKIRQGATREPVSESKGRNAADAFRLFDEGKNPADVVRELQLDPELVKRLYLQWANFHGSIVVDARTALDLEYCSLSGTIDSIRTQDDILRVFKEAAREQRAPCLCCERWAPRFCLACTLEAPRRVQAIARKRMAEAGARAEEKHHRDVEREMLARATENAKQANAAGG